MQMKLDDLDTVQNGVLVDRDGPTEFNGFTWRVTFLDNAQAGGGDFVLSPYTNSLITTNGSGSPHSYVTTKLLVDGETYSVCSGTQIIPSYGGLIKGLHYFARVSAVNSKGYSSAIKASSPQAPMIVPGLPTGVTLDVASSNELMVIFGPPVDNGGDSVSQYLIEWSASDNFESIHSTTLDYLIGGSPFFKTIGNLTMGQDYFFRVRARNSQGFGIAQVSTPASLNPHQTPSPPTSIRLEVTSEQMITVGWSPPSSNGGDSIHTYRVEWDTNADFSSTNIPPHKGFVDVDASIHLSNTINLLSQGKSYFTRVFAINSAGIGGSMRSHPLYVTPQKQVPGKVHSLVATPGNLIGTINVFWQFPKIPHHGLPCFGSNDNPLECPTHFGGGTPSSDGGDPIYEYEVEFNERNDFGGSDGGREVVTNTLVTISDLTGGRSYYVRALARNSVGSGSFTTEEIMVVAT